jgi:PEP-CTERM motif
MKSFAAILGVGLLCLSASSMRADGVGTPVTGDLNIVTLGTTNWWNAAFGFVPAGYGNSGLINNPTVVISNAITEFGFSNGTDLITADFTGSTLTLTESCVTGPTCGESSYTATFFDPDFSGFSAISAAPGFSPFTYDSTTQLLTATFTVPAGVAPTGGSLVLGYTVTPEPGTLGLMATGLLGVAGVIRRRFIA